MVVEWEMNVVGVMVVIVVEGMTMDVVKVEVNMVVVVMEGHPILLQETPSLRSQDHQEQGLLGEDEMEWCDMNGW